MVMSLSADQGGRATSQFDFLVNFPSYDYLYGADRGKHWNVKAYAYNDGTSDVRRSIGLLLDLAKVRIDMELVLV